MAGELDPMLPPNQGREDTHGQQHVGFLDGRGTRTVEFHAAKESLRDGKGIFKTTHDAFIFFKIIVSIQL
ncbi:hypothetical protein OAB11_02310 [Verrucomicrobia bacterium]|nr:hypothetical protein [Verrucomicrobiota bacterium]